MKASSYLQNPVAPFKSVACHSPLGTPIADRQCAGAHLSAMRVTRATQPMTSPRAPVGARASGFTLIEILVVIVIVAVLSTFVTLTLNFRNVSKTVSDEARRIGLQMQMASDQAIYTRQQFGIRFHPETYEFYQLIASDDGDPVWEVVENEQLSYRPPDEEIEYQVDIEGIAIVLETLEDERKAVTEEEPIKPHVLFLSNGEIMPDFRVVVADRSAEFRQMIYSGEVEPIVVEALE